MTPLAFIAPIIGAIAGLSAVGTAIVGTAIAVGAGYLARKLAPAPTSRDYNPGTAGMRLSPRFDPNAEREVAFGRCASAGTLVYQNVYGPNGNDFAQLVYALADHQCDGIEGVIVNGKYRALEAFHPGAWVTGFPVSGRSDNIWVAWHDGAWDQDADADLIARSGDKWTSSHRGRGVAYVRVTLRYDAEVFADGMPRLVFVFRGIRLYDPRKDTTAGGSGDHRWGDPSTYEWTANPAVCLYNWRRGIYVNGERLTGMATVPAAMPLDNWFAAMNACDETVARRDGSGNDPRYRMHGIIGGDDNRTVIRAMLAAMAGEEVDTGGVIKCLPGVAQAPVMSITDDDLMLDQAVEITPKNPRSQLVNAVLGSFHDPDSGYESMPLPPRISSADEAIDGGERWAQSYALDLVCDQRQGQRVLEILRRKARAQLRVSIPLRARCATLEAGDWIVWNSDRYGYVNQMFSVEEAPQADDLSVPATLQATAAGIFAWDPATDELDPLDPVELPSGGATFTTVTGLTAQNFAIVGGVDGIARPGIRITWDVIEDYTVTSLIAEYRRTGDDASLSVEILDPGAGSHAWVQGVQGGTLYEVRVKPVTAPPRAVAWTGWVSTGGSSGAQIVASALISEQANSVPPDTITPEMLSAQALFELKLVTDIDAIQGSVAEQIKEAYGWAQQVGEAALASLVQGQENGARLLTETTERVNGLNALAQQITTAVTWIGENEASISEVIESIDGIKAGWGVSININGQVVGLVRLDGAADESQLTIVADKLAIAHPDVAGGDPVPVFTLSEIDGETKAHIAGELIADAIRAGSVSVESLSAIVANLGIITAGRLQNADNTTYFDLDTGAFQIG